MAMDREADVNVVSMECIGGYQQCVRMSGTIDIRLLYNKKDGLVN